MLEQYELLRQFLDMKLTSFYIQQLSVKQRRKAEELYKLFLESKLSEDQLKNFSIITGLPKEEVERLLKMELKKYESS